MKRIQEQLGHSAISNSVSRFAYPDSRFKVLSAAEMDKALPGNSPSADGELAADRALPAEAL